MRNIKIIEHVSLDGVIQAPGDPNETTTADGRRMRTRLRERPMVAAHGEAFDLLLDRRTYDIFADVFRRRVQTVGQPKMQVNSRR